VNRQIEETLGAALARWVDGVRRRPLLVTTSILALVAVSLVHTGRELEIHGATEQLFAHDLPFKEAERRYHEAFPLLYENLFVVVDAATPERAGEAASRLADALRERPETFRAVYLPGGGEFFERHSFLYLDTHELEDLADRLAEVQPYLAELSRDGTLRGLSSMMARGVRAVRDGDVSGERLSTMFEKFDEAVQARLEGRHFDLSWAEVLAHRDFELDGRRRFLLVQPVLDFNDLQPAKRAIVEVRSVVRELGLEADEGVLVRITGDVALSYEEMETVREQAARAGILSFLTVGVILFLGLRSARLVLSALLTLLVGLVLTAGFTTVAIGHLNLISVSFAVLFIGLGIDFGIHVCVRYRELLRHGHEHALALVESARDVGSSLCLCAATTAIGFFAFVPTDFVGVAELGLISGAGMFVSLFCTLTLLPALLSLWPLPAGRVEGGVVEWSGSGLAGLPVRYPRAVRLAALVLGVGAIVLLPQARFDHNPLNVRDPSTESVRTFNELLETGGTSPWSLNAVAPDLASAERLAGRLRELPTVERVMTVADFVPANQARKLDIIEDVALFLGPATRAGEPEGRPSASEQVEALRGLRREIRKLLAGDPPAELVPVARRLEVHLDRYLARLGSASDPRPSLRELEESVVGTLSEQLRMLEAALTAGHVTLEKLPEALLQRMVAQDGRVRVQVFPSEDLGDAAALAAFVDSVREVAPGVTGSAIEVLESGRAVVKALRQAMLAAVVVITVMLLLLWRRLTDTALVLIPLALAAALTVAAAVLAGIPFNFADVIVLPLLLGIGVDSGIHLVHRARISGGADTNLLATSTARAVLFSALTTIAGFGSLGLATHLGLQTLGRLLTLGVAFTLLCNLVVLPALIVLHAPRARPVAGSSGALAEGQPRP